MPILTIKNQHFTADIDTEGAQLVSLRRNATGEEYIWQRDEAFWGESAPICFPIVGMLDGGGFEHDGTWYDIAKHGCVRYLPFFRARHTDRSLALSVMSTTQTRKSYPFSFKLTISFSLDDDGLRVGYLVENMGQEEMPMALGYHPAFALSPAAAIGDYSIVFDKKEKCDLHGITPEGFGLREKGYLDGTRISLSETLFDDDALVFKNIKSQTITLERADSDWRLEMDTGGAPHLAIWSKPRAPFVCIEPWYICPDVAGAPKELRDKPDMRLISAGDSFKSGYKIRPLGGKNNPSKR